MVEVNPSRFKLRPYEHQLEGVRTLLKKPVYGLFWKMRLGKTKAVIDTACLLLEQNVIDTVLVCCPAQVKDVWLDPDLGEIRRHAWLGYDSIFHYCRKTEDRLDRARDHAFIVTSYEFLRQEDAQGDFPKARALANQLKMENRDVLLVMDEMSVLGTWNSLQVKVMEKLRYCPVVKRVIGLDGTPAGNSTLALYSKFRLLDKSILGYKNFWHFRAAHANTVDTRYGAGRKFKKIVGYKNLERLADQTKPFCEYLGQETLDMPEKVPTLLSVALSPKTWKVYKQVRDDLVAELDKEILAIGNMAVVVLRLAQICSGFLGGFDNLERPEEKRVEELSDESTKAYLAWLDEQLEWDPNFKTVVWCRFRPELSRLITRLQQKYEGRVLVPFIYGGGSELINVAHPEHPYDGPFVLVGQVQAAQYGLNFAKAGAVTYLSQDYNLVARQQSEDRVQAPKVRKTTLMQDVLVTGPDGQRTVVHDIIKAIRSKEQLAARTVEHWRKALED